VVRDSLGCFVCGHSILFLRSDDVLVGCEWEVIGGRRWGFYGDGFGYFLGLIVWSYGGSVEVCLVCGGVGILRVLYG